MACSGPLALARTESEPVTGPPWGLPGRLSLARGTLFSRLGWTSSEQVVRFTGQKHVCSAVMLFLSLEAGTHIVCMVHMQL